MINRRRFIETGSLASLGSIISNVSFTRAQSKLNKELGVQIHSVRPQLIDDFEGTLSKISRIGYKNIWMGISTTFLLQLTIVIGKLQ